MLKYTFELISENGKGVSRTEINYLKIIHYQYSINFKQIQEKHMINNQINQLKQF